MLPSQKVKVPDFSLCDKGTSAKFLNMTIKAWFAKTFDKLDFIKIKNFCSMKQWTMKDIVQRMKKQIQNMTKCLQNTFLKNHLFQNIKKTQKSKTNYWSRDSRPLHKDMILWQPYLLYPTYFLHHPSSVSIQVHFVDKEMEAWRNYMSCPSHTACWDLISLMFYPSKKLRTWWRGEEFHLFGPRLNGGKKQTKGPILSEQLAWICFEK